MWAHQPGWGHFGGKSHAKNYFSDNICIHEMIFLGQTTPPHYITYTMSAVQHKFASWINHISSSQDFGRGGEYSSKEGSTSIKERYTWIQERARCVHGISFNTQERHHEGGKFCRKKTKPSPSTTGSAGCTEVEITNSFTAHLTTSALRGHAQGT